MLNYLQSCRFWTSKIRIILRHAKSITLSVIILSAKWYWITIIILMTPWDKLPAQVLLSLDLDQKILVLIPFFPDSSQQTFFRNGFWTVISSKILFKPWGYCYDTHKMLYIFWTLFTLPFNKIPAVICRSAATGQRRIQNVINLKSNTFLTPRWTQFVSNFLGNGLSNRNRTSDERNCFPLLFSI